MTAKPSANAPLLFDRQAVSHLVVPVMADRRAERGVAVAMQLAAAWGVPVKLVHIGPLGDGPSGEPSAVIEMAVDLHRHHPTVCIETMAFDHDDVAVAIDDAADGNVLIVLATDHARQWLGDESVAERLVQRRSGPLLLIGPMAEGYDVGGEFIVALDGTPLAEDGIAVGVALAAAADTSVRITSVIPTATLEHIEHLKERGQRVSESAYLRAVAERLADEPAPVAWEIVHDEAAIDALVGLAARRRAAMLVATTHAGTGVARQQFGSTTMGLVERATVPVMVVHPTGSAQPPVS